MTEAADNAPRGPFELQPWVTCSACRTILPYIHEALDSELAGDAVRCLRCHGIVGWWEGIREAIRTHFVFGQVAAFGGARTLMLEVLLDVGEVAEVDLTLHGVPSDARLVHMYLSPQGGGVWPMMHHGNEAIPGPIYPKFALYGRPFPPFPGSAGNGGGPLKISVMATWFQHRADDTVERHLVDAARAYQEGRFDGVVVPANIAAEASLGPIMTQFFARFGSKEHVKDMLTSGATYSHQVNVLLNVVADVLGVPRLPAEIRGLLNRLRKLRNTAAHEGACPPQVREDAVGHLAAAIAMVRYAAVLSAKTSPEGTRKGGTS